MKRLLFILLISVIEVHAMGVHGYPSVGRLIADARELPLIDMHEFVFQKLDDGYSLLHAAARDHDVETMKYLIKMGLDVNDSYTGNTSSKTPLMVAVDVAFKHKKFVTLAPVVILLCEKGAVPSREYCAHFDMRCKNMNIYDDEHIKKCSEILATQLRKQ